MKQSIVITGSTRGIGYGLVDEFLKRECQVLLNGRSQESVDAALAALSDRHGTDRIAVQAGDVVVPDVHEAIWAAAVAAFGKVDIWINNAGVGHPYLMGWEIPTEKIDQVVDINLKGMIYGSQVAVRRMLQQGFGHLYNMEGFGSNGRIRPGLSVYGSTKSALSYFTRSLAAEVEGTPVKVSSLSPGMVITDFITEQYQDDPEGFEQTKAAFNALGDKVETVTPWLADQVLANDKSGAAIKWLTTPKIMTRLAIARFNKRDLFD
ncbi:MAG: SDR family oxidoreductase [Chloroflexota bacterium]